MSDMESELKKLLPSQNAFVSSLAEAIANIAGAGKISEHELSAYLSQYLAGIRDIVIHEVAMRMAERDAIPGDPDPSLN